MNFSLSTAFSACCRFSVVVSSLSFVSRYFLISFLIFSQTHGFFSSMLFSLHVVGFFSFLFPWLVSNFMALWSEKILEIISMLLNLLRVVLCPTMWSVLENVPYVLDRMYIMIFFGCNVLKTSIKYKYSIVSFIFLLPY